MWERFKVEYTVNRGCLSEVDEVPPKDEQTVLKMHAAHKEERTDTHHPKASPLQLIVGQ